MKPMTAEHQAPVDAPRSDRLVHRIHRAKRHAPWRYSTSITTDHLFTEDRADELSEFLSLAARYGASSVQVKVGDGAISSMERVLGDAHVRNIGVVVDPVTTTLETYADWLEAGATGIHTTSESTELGGLVLAVPGAIRTTTVDGTLDDLAETLAQDWIEVTSWPGLAEISWEPDTLTQTLADVYAVYETVGAVPAWTLSSPASSFPADALTLACLALPGAVTVDIELLRLIPEARRAIRYREQLRLDEAPLSWARDGDVLELISGELSCFINTGKAPAPLPPSGRIIASTGESACDLAPHSTTWIIHPKR